MEHYVLFAVLFCTAVSLSPPSVTKVYRSDYEYNGRTKAFYKLHTEARRGWDANNVCKIEGASLMNPDSQSDIVQLHGMFKRYPDLGDYVFVAQDGRDHESAEEPSIINLTPSNEEEYPNMRETLFGNCNVVSRIGEIEAMPCYHSKPFICKVDLKDAPYDPHCDLYGKDYQYNATVGSCYKIPPRVASWNEAYAECRAEGSHLVVLNSEAERAVVQQIMRDAPKLEQAKWPWFFYAGFRANKPAIANETLIFKTIFNETLEEAGFAEWSPNEPNNALSNEFCGTLFANDGKLNDVDCSHLFAFICEKEVEGHNHR